MFNPPVKILAVLFTCLFSLSCLSEDKPIDDVNTLRPNVNQNANVNVNANANVVDDSEIKLKEMVNLPYEPIEDSPWREEELGNKDNRAPGPTDRKLTAVLKFSEEDTKKILETASKNKEPFDTDVDAESWFPAELIAKSETTGDNTLKGKGYSADEFVKPPYSVGTLVFIEGADYFILVLQTK